jgi:hypothetical protein
MCVLHSAKAGIGNSCVVSYSDQSNKNCRDRELSVMLTLTCEEQIDNNL